MKSIDSLINDLESKDSAIRDKAAISLMDIGDSSAVAPIIKAIKNPSNINRRGTLVYALSEFDMSDHINLLIDLVVTGNYEVATGSFHILEEIKLNKAQKKQIQSQLNNINVKVLIKEHNRDGYQYLIELLK